MELLTAIENTSLGIWVRESGSIWSYPSIIFLHSVGLAFLVGVNAFVDLRLLGFAPTMSIAPMERLFPIMWFGFWVNALSGIPLLIADASTMLTSWIFYVKMGCVALAMINMAVIRGRVFTNPASAGTRPSPPGSGAIPTNIKVLAAASLLLWAAAITAGRLTAYLGPGAAIKGGG